MGVSVETTQQASLTALNSFGVQARAGRKH